MTHLSCWIWWSAFYEYHFTCRCSIICIHYFAHTCRFLKQIPVSTRMFGWWSDNQLSSQAHTRNPLFSIQCQEACFRYIIFEIKSCLTTNAAMFRLIDLSRIFHALTKSCKHPHHRWWRHQMETFPRYWPFVRGIHRSPVNSPHKGQWRGAFMFTLICACINGWVNTRKAGDVRRIHYDVTAMILVSLICCTEGFNEWGVTICALTHRYDGVATI